MFPFCLIDLYDVEINGTRFGVCPGSWRSPRSFRDTIDAKQVKSCGIIILLFCVVSLNRFETHTQATLNFMILHEFHDGKFDAHLL